MIFLDKFNTIFKPGSVYMLHDSMYAKNKKNKASDLKTNTIRFDRPCIVLQVSKDQDVVTIIPLTTKTNQHHTLYPIQIEENKQSYAILSQITTVDAGKLSSYIGEVKQSVFRDLKSEYRNYFEDGESFIYRKVPSQFNDLDVHRFYPFRLYQNKNDGKFYLCLRTISGSILFVNIIPSDEIDLNDIKRHHSNYTIIGSYDLSTIICHFPMPNATFNYEDLECIGYEYNSSVREAISNKLESIYGISISMPNYDDNYIRLTEAIVTIYGYGRKYLVGLDELNEVIHSNNNIISFIKDIKGFINNRRSTKNKKDIKNNQVAPLREYVLNNVDILKTPVTCLHYMSKNYPELFKNKFNNYKIIFDKKEGNKIFNGKYLFNKYNPDNMTWLNLYYEQRIK